MSGPVARLQQVVTAIKGHLPANPLSAEESTTEDSNRTPFVNEHALRFQAGLPKGLPVNHTPLNPIQFLLRSAMIRPDRVAMTHPAKGVSWTYSQWAMRVCALAYALKKRGIKRGDFVCVICPNVPMILDLQQALPAVHAIIVPMNIRLTKPEVDYILEHSGTKMIIVDHEFAHLAENFEKSGKGEVIVSYDSAGKDPNDPYEQLIAEGKEEAERRGWQDLTLIDDEEAGYNLCYTSGTTGRPKGVLTSYRGTYLAALANVFQAEMNADSNYLWILPAFHAAGWTYPCAITAASSGQVCLRSVGDYTPVWDALDNHKVTTYCAAPTVQLGIVNHPRAHKLPQKVTAVIAGAAPSATLIAGLEKLNIHVQHVYGLTETYGPFTGCIQLPEWDQLSTEEFYRRKAMQGNSYVTCDEVRVVRTESSEKDGYEDVAADGKEVGEIVVRGNLVMKEYYNDPAATAKAFAGGYFHSGDLAVREPHGAISIQDRSKDLIISGGENASTLAIESVIFQHPDVLEVAVVARPHEKWGERAMAYVILKEASRGNWKGREGEFEKDLIGFTKDKLPGYARPEWCEVVEELPKTSTGKIQKHVLRTRFKSAITGK